MKRFLSLIAAVSFVIPVITTARDEITPALAALADAERAFAKTATVKGIRDSFLEFFADDAVALVPEPASWKARLQSRPSVPFGEHELLWEPRVGDIAGSGELGWLTGPSTFTNRKDKQLPQHGNYLSVWRRQPEGTWKVFLDIGSDSPVPVRFEAGFQRFAFGPRYSGTEEKAAGTAALLAQDRALNARLASEAASAAYASFLASNVRLHRQGHHPTIGAGPAVEWVKRNMPSLEAATGTAESARSADFGYSYGTYTTKDTDRKGSYLRLWSRRPDGRWLIVTEVLTPPPPVRK